MFACLFVLGVDKNLKYIMSILTLFTKLFFFCLHSIITIILKNRRKSKKALVIPFKLFLDHFRFENPEKCREMTNP